jgi:hypothetical protein
VIGVRSLWADDPLYPIARRSNIRIVEVDAARPVDGALPGIAVQPGLKVDGLNSQPWLASNNMGRMADVIAADLVRLAPSAKPKIEANLAALKQRLLKLSADSEARLAEVDNLSVLSLSDHFGYLIGSLESGADWSGRAAGCRVDSRDLKKLTSTLKDNDVALVLHHRQPSEAVKAAIAASGSHLLVLSTDAEDPVAELEGNVDLLLKGLSGGLGLRSKIAAFGSSYREYFPVGAAAGCDLEAMKKPADCHQSSGFVFACQITEQPSALPSSGAGSADACRSRLLRCRPGIPSSGRSCPRCASLAARLCNPARSSIALRG